MRSKDYYSILGIEVSANLQEMKKAYRKLAQQYHPDKNQNDPYASAQFGEIKEAYEVLTNPAKKEYYLQQRWYNQSIGKRKSQAPVTPINILKQVLELDKYVSLLDVHRMDKQGLYSYIADSISDSTIEKLNVFGETGINKEIISLLLHCISFLPAQLASPLHNRLLRIKSDQQSIEKINSAIHLHHKISQREKYRVWVLLLIVLLLSLMIFFLNQ